MSKLEIACLIRIIYKAYTAEVLDDMLVLYEYLKRKKYFGKNDRPTRKALRLFKRLGLAIPWTNGNDKR